MIEDNQLYDYNENKKIFHDINTGIIGEVYKRNQNLSIYNPYNSEFFNKTVDIETSTSVNYVLLNENG